ncbi:glycosyltransferase [Pseudodesulfovibrio cashew]|uniref:Glycosyltransferase n=1 Tax=Pseudodesulfovibrio cashew TaxID=2678688 RepID=A0A6I6JFQ1_9BACT|nr:glycosyltransferase family 2 protein [Pseudodesulfovibrio cashew]QGY39343.1 glycosyltransferase [Pseudodesulfovibrio cashew]
MMQAQGGFLTSHWASLPEALKVRLRLGFTGKRHLLEVAGWCLRSGDPALSPLAADALLTAFGENPLDGEMATELLARDEVRALLPKETLTALAYLAGAWRKPANTGYLERLLALRDFGKLKTYLADAIAKEPGNLFWLQQAVAFGLIDGDPDWVEAMFARYEGQDTPVMTNVLARTLAFRGRYGEAARRFQNAGNAFGPSFAASSAGLCMLGEGDPASAHLLLLEAVANAPWNASLAFRLHDLLTGWDRETRPVEGSTAVLLYTWNNEVEIDATLRSLFESDLTGASVFVLDNGSTDSTPLVLESWGARFEKQLGAKRFSVITLPVNIGAPAARNWLLHHTPAAGHDFLCYLDDDVILPPDWLLRLGAAVRRYPDAGAWGCKVVDHANPALIQSADGHLLVEEVGPPLDLSRPEPNPFRLSDLHIQGLDSGMLNAMRPCASVTGCCHLFRTSVLQDSGDFAIQLSPTQYDDMEHDLRLCEAGRFPVYQGHLAVRHRKRTGAASRTSAREEGNALGNKYKMQTMHAREDLLEAMAGEQAVMEADLVGKLKTIDQA